MTAYIRVPAKPKAWWGDDNWDAFDDPPARASVDVDEASGPQFTGLYDKDGTPLYRLPKKIGFR